MSVTTRFCFFWLAAAFFLSFYQYVIDDRYVVGAAAPLMIIILAGLFSANKSKLRQGERRGITGASLLFGVGLPAVTLAASLFGGIEYSILYGLLLVATLISMRIVLGSVSLATVLAAFALGGLMSFPFVLIKLGDYGGSYTEWGRFQPYSFHPNLVAFVLVPMTGLLAWASSYFPRSIRIALIAASGVPLLVAYEASSRGSLFAIVIAAALCLALRDYRQFVGDCGSRQRAATMLGLAIKWTLLAAPIVIIALHFALPNFVSSDIVASLDLENKDRGLDSGLTGRVYNWARLVDEMGWRGILFGNGFRATESLIDYDIDNGFFVMYFDFGLVVSCLVMGRFAYIAWMLFKSLRQTNCRARLGLIYASLFCVFAFLLNNVVSRYLFGIGNPYSLLGLFFYMCSYADILRSPLIPARSAVANCRATGSQRCTNSGAQEGVRIVGLTAIPSQRRPIDAPAAHVRPWAE